MDDELLDLVDKDDNVIGTVWKSESEGSANLVCRAIAVVIFNKHKQVLLQQRSLFKIYDPGVWRLSASGHVGAGESPAEAAEREPFEELGIKIKPIFYKKALLDVSGKNQVKLPRIFYVYYAFDKNNQKITQNTAEVEQVKWIKLDYLEDFARSNNYDLSDFSHQTIVEVAKILKIL